MGVLFENGCIQLLVVLCISRYIGRFIVYFIFCDLMSNDVKFYFSFVVGHNSV